MLGFVVAFFCCLWFVFMFGLFCLVRLTCSVCLLYFVCCLLLKAGLLGIVCVSCGVTFNSVVFSFSFIWFDVLFAVFGLIDNVLLMEESFCLLF